MPLKIAQQGPGLKKLVSPSNKSGLTGFHEAQAFELPGGKVVAISRPFIDRIALIGVVPPSAYGAGDLASEGPGQFGSVLKAALDDADCGLTKTAGGKARYAKGWPKPGEKVAYIKVGARNARVDVRVQPMLGPNKAIMAWRLRLEWNPRKARQEGIERLFDLLAYHLHFEKEGAEEWFRNAEVTRLDIAVEILGVDRADLFTTLAGQKKVMLHGQWSTGVQTVTQRPTSGPKGKGGLITYDKRQERLDKKKAPKFGDEPHLRVERRLAFTGGKAPIMRTLMAEKDRLSDVSVRLLRDLPAGPSKLDQQAIAGAALWLGWKRMSSEFPSSTWTTLRKPDPFFWDTAYLWSHWPSAIEEAGLLSFASP